jgi:hypothetical protein
MVVSHIHHGVLQVVCTDTFHSLFILISYRIMPGSVLLYTLRLSLNNRSKW